MEGHHTTSASRTIPVTSYETALCILLPVEQCEHIDNLRELYDKAYGAWPAHINLVYPFVAPEHLPQARQQIQAQIQSKLNSFTSRQVKLESAVLLQQRHNSTAVLQESRDSSGGSLDELRSLSLEALGHKPQPNNFHLTVGQTEDNSLASREFLLSKLQLLPTLSFEIGPLVILVRERTSGSQLAYRMRLWGLIDTIFAPTRSTVPTPEYWLRESSSSAVDEEQEDDEAESSHQTKKFIRTIKSGKSFFFDKVLGIWIKAKMIEPSHMRQNSLVVSSYNVLVKSEFPPAQNRDPLLIRTLLSDTAEADITVLQEVSDNFLSALLNHPDIQKQYPFSSHGPPSQPDIGPLPSLRNVVIISKWPFRWDSVPFHRRHKGAVVATFDSAAIGGSLVVAGIHLTCGLTDGSVAAKKIQIQKLFNYLTYQHSDSPWIVAGDFNLTTSVHTIDNALELRSITGQTKHTLAAVEDQLRGDGLLDAWVVTRNERISSVISVDTNALFDGEEGATFDPRNNILAAESSGTSQNRPQRYDRILVRPRDKLQITGFRMFGLPAGVDGTNVVPSDHYGVRASMQLCRPPEQLSPDHHELLKSFKVAFQNRSHLALPDLESALQENHMFLSEEERTKRQAAFHLLREAVLGKFCNESSVSADVPLRIVPVGSFALNVDTSTSDIDCLCIGSISSKIFFKLARQRLQRAETYGIRILRKVEASTGTMLELSVNDVVMDLQYCPAARIVERWSEIDGLAPSDPIFNLSILSLRKLKPYRDLAYIKRTLPDLSTFSVAYRAIKLWAFQRGIYSSKFGYLGGIHITQMLSWVYKRVAHDVATHGDHLIAVGDLVATFFHYYANFNWANDMVFDVFFHRHKPRYHRTTREPMVILGLHPPNSNIAHTSTLPGLLTLVKEFKTADSRLSDPSTTWQSFFMPTGIHTFDGMGIGETEFLQAYKSYVRIDIHFWGRTLAKGKGLVGWVESRCLPLVIDIHRNFPESNIRLWPARFADNELHQLDENKDYNGCYLIGLQGLTNANLMFTNRDERQAAKQSLDKIIEGFLTQLRMDEKNYDANSSWIDASIVTQRDLRKLQLDKRDWGVFAMEIEPDSDEEEELDDVNTDDVELPKQPMRCKPKSSSKPVSMMKLRPASDVLNRLRWDPSLDPTDYIIGYEDRFIGTKEISLEKWKTEQTDEEFIPQHRILFFRKKVGGAGNSKGEVVWERATRIDKVFGSGAGAGL
ncbi:hypothetical protein C7974DRAFT_390010 [Boeremia exigua]|uniref:uncharacterized protein n=1 Tax=Boeremia exigua TaxID=749465 RepID=UPI001E8D28E4|nr:uncharacterized protein C7974DRAFT_390010 [Boeremia exigua]KAH6637689.1 hypothetical protein C7974DRAFT_390010 [Boeremia exigua]